MRTVAERCQQVRQAGLRRGVVFLAIFFSLVFIPAFSAGNLNYYKIISTEEQFVVYASDPVAGQEVATLAESTRAKLFSTLGWAGYSPFPTEIWILDEKPAPNFPPAASSIDLVEGTWKKKITTTWQPGLKEEILPREIVTITLTELANEKKLFQPKKRELALPPLWLVEGLRVRLAEVDSKESAVPVDHFQDIARLLQPLSFSKNPELNRQYAAAASRFVNFILALPKGGARLKEFLKTLGEKGDRQKSFFAVYRPFFDNAAHLQLAWEVELDRTHALAATMPTEERRREIALTLDSLDLQ